MPDDRDLSYLFPGEEVELYPVICETCRCFIALRERDPAPHDVQCRDCEAMSTIHRFLLWSGPNTVLGRPDNRLLPSVRAWVGASLFALSSFIDRWIVPLYSLHD